MKTSLALLALLALGLFGHAAAADEIVQRPPLTPDQLEQLVSPIALYPDPLVALILPATTFPSDVVLAARFLDRGGSPDTASTEPWDDSVRALARYREVVDYLDDHLEWTRRLGQSFLDQPDAVMDAIQMVRIRARAAGLLTDTPEQHIIVEDDEVCIVPAQPSIIYVPRYDPWVICRPSIPAYGRGPFITFGVGCTVGTWLRFDCDWRARSVCIVDRPAHWYHSPRWDDRNRHREFAVTNWTRHTPYGARDNRFDRSPRVAHYEVPGRDHREWSDHNRGNDRTDNRRYSPATPVERSRNWQNGRHSDTNVQKREVLNPLIGGPVIPPVATPLPEAPRPVPSYRRPDTRGPGGNERFQPSNRVMPNRPSERVAPAVPDTVNRARPAERAAPPPVQRAETPTRADSRRDNDSPRDNSRGGRDTGRTYQLR
jgi:hypothetical protein